ncbi:hypothetical protein BP6252_03839 [Coleophoma cylindrospora]|uniref:Uncharacterized protein n=1 Tax=Coleophoma cylindrospora TaxID=1849047 RepID=A0A3D8S8P2_9HELO|nr:hypothetical protein BP6252_03839 [Coleophoma cylindrospora]
MNKGNTIMRKLLRQPTNVNGHADSSINDSPQLRPSASQNTVYSAGSPITCLDRSPDGSHAVFAGPKVFKTLKIDGSTISEDIDLRALITDYAANHDISAATSDRLTIKSVAWSHGSEDSKILTACANGRVTLYDLNKLGEGLEVARIHEHTRQVHKLAINPFRAHVLLSASQDGTVKSFDIRNRIQGRSGLVLKTWQNFKCNADAVRDVKWSPIDGMEFACSTDAGVIQKWDLRKGTAPVLKIPAHTKACFSIAWHPDGEHLISGGLDQKCYVWDFSKKGERNQKYKYSFDTPAPVSTVSWRPACWSATAQGRRAAQVTVSYDDTNSNKMPNPSVHIWDLARPGIPFKEIDQWDTAPTGLLWSTRDLLWGVDRDGHFTQTDVAFIPKVIDRRTLSDLSFSSNGDLLMVLEERQTPRRPRPTISPADVPSSFSQSPNGPQLSVSRSDSEDDVIGGFLGPKLRKSFGRHGARSSHASTSTPNSSMNGNTGKTENKVMSLDEAVMVTGPYKPRQVMAIGQAPSTAKRSLYEYLTNRYLSRLEKSQSTPYSVQTPEILLASTTEYFARTAEHVGHYRLAQTWRILGYTMGLLLTRRAEYHRQSRLAPQKPERQQENKQVKVEKDKGEETPRKLPRSLSPLESPIYPVGRSIIAEEVESTSNVATPLVRPVRDTFSGETSEATITPLASEENVENDVLKLPPPSFANSPSPIPVPGASQSPRKFTSEPSNVEGYDFYGVDSISPAENLTAVPQRKQPLRLDYPEPSAPSQRMQVGRHDSGESFAMFSTSGDSQSRFMSSSESDISRSIEKENGKSLREAVSTWENSFTSSSAGHRPSVDSLNDPQYSSFDGHNASASSNGLTHALPQKRPSPPTLIVQQASFREAVDDTNADGDASDAQDDLNHLSDDPNIIESDYYSWPNDPKFVDLPIDPTVLVQRTIQFETQTGVLNASAIMLLLGPLLPPKTLDAVQSAAILRQYHQRLQNFQLFTEATLLRNLCVPTYPTVWEDSQKDINVGYFCTDCQKPLENDPLIPGSMWRCPRCRGSIDGCAVCRHREPEESLTSGEKSILLWWSCPGCGHGGHLTCMQAWHDAPSDGCCPLEGCLHPCLPGPWREQREVEKRSLQAKEMDRLVRENSAVRGKPRSVSVRRDAREVNQSKAVEGVRVALALSQGSGGMERRRSVKVVAPGEKH